MTHIRDADRRRSVLIIDDSRAESDEYRESLKAFSAYDIAVESIYSASDAVEQIAEVGKSWDVIILDMMMPCGNGIDREEAGGGKFTGIVVAREIRRARPDTPIILISNAPFSDVKEACRKIVERLENTLFWLKCDMPPRELVKLLDCYFGEGRLVKPSRSLLSRVFGALLLQPNVGGVGVDVKKLVE